ncbi:MAG: hypothetical protein NZM00_04585 [Anaerolinea sp.]|nr:hypothetical protein [Anaerolinea sp.]
MVSIEEAHPGDIDHQQFSDCVRRKPKSPWRILQDPFLQCCDMALSNSVIDLAVVRREFINQLGHVIQPGSRLLTFQPCIRFLNGVHEHFIAQHSLSADPAWMEVLHLVDTQVAKLHPAHWFFGEQTLIVVQEVFSP